MYIPRNISDSKKNFIALSMALSLDSSHVFGAGIRKPWGYVDSTVPAAANEGLRILEVQENGRTRGTTPGSLVRTERVRILFNISFFCFFGSSPYLLMLLFFPPLNNFKEFLMLTRSLLIGARRKNSYRGADALGTHISSAVSRASTYKRALENSSTSTL